MQKSDHDPQQNQQAQNQQRIVDPQGAGCVDKHANVCSYERLFERKRAPCYRRISVGALLGLTLVLTSCVADPQRAQSVDLLDRLTTARGMLDQQTPLEEACTAVGDVQTRLYGEPGLVDVQPAWARLRDASNALQAVCGQTTLLLQPATGTSEVQAAQQRWQVGIQRELGVACDHLRAAATALDRGTPC